MTVKCVVFVRGGRVIDVIASKPMDFAIVDHDNEEQGGLTASDMYFDDGTNVADFLSKFAAEEVV